MIASHDSYIEYYRLLPSSASWREAFRTAFGITTHDFFTAFEAYRAAPSAPRGDALPR